MDEIDISKYKIATKSKYIGQFKIGQKINNWTVLDDKIYHKINRATALLYVRCSCKREIMNDIYNIYKSNNCRVCNGKIFGPKNIAKRCAAHRRVKYINVKKGAIINNWNILSNPYKHKKGYLVVKAKCTCSISNLVQIRTLGSLFDHVSCKKCWFIVHKEKFTELNKAQRYGYKNICGRELCSIRQHANRKGHFFFPDLNVIDNFYSVGKFLYELLQFQNNKCKYCNVELTNTSNDPAKRSLDRIDNTKGYLTNNVQWLCKRCNLDFKNDLSEEELEKLCINFLKYKGYTINDFRRP